MAIPDFNQHGLLPTGVHQCSMADVAQQLGWNGHRQGLVEKLRVFLNEEIRPSFPDPVEVDGSFVTDKEEPEDVDVVLDLQAASDERQFRGWLLLRDRRSTFREMYSVDFWINLPGGNSFSMFFQYVGAKASSSKGLSPKYRKGILRVL